jgi:hypothetical protein
MQPAFSKNLSNSLKSRLKPFIRDTLGLKYGEDVAYERFMRLRSDGSSIPKKVNPEPRPTDAEAADSPAC